MIWEYLVGDVREVLAGLPERSVQCIVTSPPYWGLRDYGIPPSIWGGDTDCTHEWGEFVRKGQSGGTASPKVQTKGTDNFQIVPDSTQAYCHCGAWRGCLGLEPTPEMFIEHLLEVCRGLWRVLRDDGTFFLNLGDGYFGDSPVRKSTKEQSDPDKQGVLKRSAGGTRRSAVRIGSLKPKDLVMMPHRVALALQADGWWVRSGPVWAKDNPMPESCTDRPTSSYEFVFQLNKRARYFYDADAVREPHATSSIHRVESSPHTGSGLSFGTGGKREAQVDEVTLNPMGRNLRNVWHIPQPLINIFMEWYDAQPPQFRDVWRIPTQPYPAAHFATFPEKIPETCIKAGTSERGCCPQCGAPWERVVEKEPSDWGERKAAGATGGGLEKGHNTTHGEGTNHTLGQRAATTKGFQPTCECVEEWKKACGADKNGEYHGKAIKDYSGTGAENPSEVKARILAGMVPKRTVGYQPTCDCPEELEPVPCVVLDPFAGSGTTLKVARDLGRSAIGIDISSDYKKLAVTRARLDTKDILSYGGETA